MDDAVVGLYPPGYLFSLFLQVAAWAVVLLASLVAVRRRWAWPGLAAGLVGTAGGVVELVDHLQARAADGWFGSPPGIIAEHDLYTEVYWAHVLAIVLVAVAVAVAAVTSRRRGLPA